MDINYKNLTVGTEIEVVVAWADTTTFEDISNGHFFKTIIEEIYFEPKGELGFLRIFAKDGDGNKRRVNWILQDGEIRNAATVVELTVLKSQNEMIQLFQNQSDYLSALTRGFDSDLQIFNGWENDTYHVRNRRTGKEYEIKLANKNGVAVGSCSCLDFLNRKRTCKHLAVVLTQIAKDKILSDLSLGNLEVAR